MGLDRVQLYFHSVMIYVMKNTNDMYSSSWKFGLQVLTEHLVWMWALGKVI